MDISKFNFNNEIINFWKSKKFEKLFLVQEKVFPLLLKNENIIVESPTGTGKTLAFLLPIFNNIKSDIKFPQAIIFTPTNQLSKQIYNNCKEIKKFKNVSIINTEKNEQKKNINNYQIIITTPEKFFKIISQQKFKNDYLKYLIIDEIDMIIDFLMIEKIGEYFKNKNLTFAFFSATIGIEKQNHIKNNIFKKNYHNILIKNKDNLIIPIFQLKKNELSRDDLLIKLINHHKFNPFFCLIFVNTNEKTKAVFNLLKEQNIKNVSIYNNEISKSNRNKIINNILNNKIVYLVTTDAFSRGIDLPFVSHIINYELPKDLKFFLHRIGRTNRNNNNGQIINIIKDEDLQNEEKIFKKWTYLKKVKWNL